MLVNNLDRIVNALGSLESTGSLFRQEAWISRTVGVPDISWRLNLTRIARTALVYCRLKLCGGDLNNTTTRQEFLSVLHRGSTLGELELYSISSFVWLLPFSGFHLP